MAAPMHTFTDRIDVLGVAKGRQSVTLTSNTTQLVTAVRFRDGQTVSRGQVLVELRAVEQDAGVDQAQAALEAARLNFERWNTLAEKGIAAPATRETYRASYDQAKAGLAAAVARRGDREIRAPFGGVVGLSDIAPGSLVNPGTAIATLDDLAVVRVDFDVPDRFLSRLHKGTPIIARAESYPGQTFAGVIAELDTRVNERTRAIKARAELPNRGNMLKPGMLMRVGIEESSRTSVAAPEAAVQFDADQAFVYVITRSNRPQGAAGVGGQRAPGAQAGGQGGFGGQGGQGAAPGGVGQGARPGGPVSGAPRGVPGTVERRVVIAGQRQDGFVEIKSGLNVGEQIVADGVNRLQANQAVLVTGRVNADGTPIAPGQRGQGAGGPGAQGGTAGQGFAGAGGQGSQRPAGAGFAPNAPAGQGGQGAARPAGAGGQGFDPADRFKAMDANGDGSVAKTEWRGPPERFDAIDANKDGKVTLREMQAAPRPPGGFGGQGTQRPAPAA
jgi:membrane fusion protein (multidrug efflux system)